MKCNNCGFESETNFCPMCGANMNTQAVSQSQNTQVYQGNPYIQNTQSAQQSVQVNQNMTNAQPVQQNMQNNPFTQNKPPMVQNPQMPVNMQAATPPVMQPAKPKSKATAGIVIAAIIGAVILIGTIIFSFSYISDALKKNGNNSDFDLDSLLTSYHTNDVAENSYEVINLK